MYLCFKRSLFTSSLIGRCLIGKITTAPKSGLLVHRGWSFSCPITWQPSPFPSSLTTLCSAAVWLATRAFSRAASWASSAQTRSVHCFSRVRTCCCAWLPSSCAAACRGPRRQSVMVAVGDCSVSQWPKDWCPVEITPSWPSLAWGLPRSPPTALPTAPGPGLFRSWSLKLVLVLGRQHWAAPSPKTQPSFTLLRAPLMAEAFPWEAVQQVMKNKGFAGPDSLYLQLPTPPLTSSTTSVSKGRPSYHSRSWEWVGGSCKGIREGTKGLEHSSHTVTHKCLNLGLLSCHDVSTLLQPLLGCLQALL